MPNLSQMIALTCGRRLIRGRSSRRIDRCIGSASTCGLLYRNRVDVGHGVRVQGGGGGNCSNARTEEKLLEDYLKRTFENHYTFSLGGLRSVSAKRPKVLSSDLFL